MTTDSSLKLVNTALWGETQSGKSTLMLTSDFEPVYLSNSCGVIGYDPHSSFTDKAGRSVVTNGHRRRLVYVDLSDLEQMVSWGFIARSKATGIKREEEHDDISEFFAEAVVDQQEGEKVQSQPLKYKYTKGVCRLWLDQEEDLDFSFLKWGLRPGTPQFDRLMKSFRGEPAIKDDFARVAAMASNSKQHEMLGPAERAISSVFDRVALKYREKPTIDLEALIVNKGILLVKGGTNTDATLRVVGKLLWNRVVQIVKHRYGQGLVTPVRCYWDEINIGLVGISESLSLGHTTKMGLTHCLAGQTPEVNNKTVTTNIMSNTPRKIWFRCASPTSALAEADIRSTLDPMLEHYRESSRKQLHAGFEHRERRTHAKGDHGETITTGHDRVPVYEDVVEERTHYVPLSGQTLMNEAKIQGFGLGECAVNNSGKVLFHKGKPWKDPGIFDGDPEVGVKPYSVSLLDQHIKWQAEVGISKPPVEVKYDTCQTPKKKGNPPSSKGANGMS